MKISNKPVRGGRAPLLLLALLASPAASRASELEAAGHREAVEATCSLTSVRSARLRRVLELADPLSEDARRVLVAYATFVELLPLERIVAVRCVGDWVQLVFDCGRRRHLDVDLPEREEWVLDRTDGDLRRGRPRLEQLKGRTLRVRNELRLRVRNGEIDSVREGDLEVLAGPVSVDLELSTRSEPGRLARDERGRILLARDARGRPMNVCGEWVPQRFDRWVRVAARKKEVWIGVEPARNERPYVAEASGS